MLAMNAKSTLVESSLGRESATIFELSFGGLRFTPEMITPAIKIAIAIALAKPTPCPNIKYPRRMVKMGNELAIGALRDMLPVVKDLYKSINPMTFKDPT